MSKQTIAVDIDDVLSASAEAFVEFSNRRWGLQMTIDQVDEDFAKAWGVTREEALPMAETFIAESSHESFRHFEEAVPILKKLKKRFVLVAVTSRRRQLKQQTDSWLSRHFPDVFDRVAYAGIFDDTNRHNVAAKLSQTKADICQELGVSYLIDDQPKHCLAAADFGIQALLFGNYAWNRHVEGVDNLVAVYDWKDVEKFFDGR